MSKINKLTTTLIHCMYCNHSWSYRGDNLTNICCPSCKNRFDVTQGKAMNFNNLRNDYLEMKESVNHLRTLFDELKSQCKCSHGNKSSRSHPGHSRVNEGDHENKP